MAKTPDVIIVHSRKVSCAGNNITSGHPKVFLEISSDKKEIFCPYCGQHFAYHEHPVDKAQNK